MKRSNHPKGFSAIELILVIVFVILLAGTGWYVWHQRQTKNTENTTTNNDVVTKPNDVSTIVSRVQLFYDSYAGNGMGGKDPKLTLDQLQAKGYITSAAVTTLKATQFIDSVLCTQGGSDQPITVGTPSITDSTAKVTVSQNYSGTGSIIPNYMYVKLVKSGSWQISAISCTQ